jgi:hypothetical protein
LNDMTINSTTFMSSRIWNLMPCTKFDAVPYTIGKNNLKVAFKAMQHL